jgi:hypothetical protein
MQGQRGSPSQETRTWPRLPASLPWTLSCSVWFWPQRTWQAQKATTAKRAWQPQLCHWWADRCVFMCFLGVCPSGVPQLLKLEGGSKWDTVFQPCHSSVCLLISGNSKAFETSHKLYWNLTLNNRVQPLTAEACNSDVQRGRKYIVSVPRPTGNVGALAS